MQSPIEESEDPRMAAELLRSTSHVPCAIFASLSRFVVLREPILQGLPRCGDDAMCHPCASLYGLWRPCLAGGRYGALLAFVSAQTFQRT